MKEHFREICDDFGNNIDQPILSKKKYNNLSLKVKSLRVFIRYLVRVFGIRFSEFILNLLSKLSPKESPSYFVYLIYLNFFRIRYLNSLSLNNFKESFRIKKAWAEYVKENSLSDGSIANANFYISIISNQNFINGYEAIDTKKKFYLYGPGATSDPNEKYSDYTLVHLKPFPKACEGFNDEILFLNSYYFKYVVEKNLSMIDILRERYKNIYVSCMTSNLPHGFERVKINNGGYIASEMALQRLLGFLLNKYGTIDCVIDGFNLFLDKNSYRNKNYHKLVADKDNKVKEEEICFSLAEHDFYFNFLITKKYMKFINLIDSDDFRNIIDLDDEVFLEKFSSARNFSTLKRL